MLNRLSVVTKAFGDNLTTNYDAVGNQTTSIDRNGREINYTYDQRDRNTAEIWLDSMANPSRPYLQYP